MRAWPVGLLLLVPSLVTAQPASDPSGASSAGWQQATSSRSTVTSAALPPLRADAAPPALRAMPDAAPRVETAGFTPAPGAATAALSPPPLAGSLSDRPMAPKRPEAKLLETRTYGPQQVRFGNVTASFDVAYQTLKGFRPLTMDIYQPARRGYPLPLVVYVHGGGFNGGDTRHGPFADFPAALASLAAQGYVVASVNYRLAGEARFPAALLDVKSAIRWLRGRAGEMNLDTTRVAVWGAGNGGQLAALAGTSCGVPALEAADLDKDAPSSCVQAVIDWYGATDMKAANGGTDTVAFLGCEPAACPPGLARLASPLSYISVTSPPFLIQHGAADSAVPPAQSQALLAALKERGVPAELVIYPNVGHDFARGTAPDPDTNQAALAKVGAFLSTTFPPGPIGVKTAQQRGPVY